MKYLLLLLLFAPGCTTIQDVTSSKINENNYMQTPCLIDGQMVKKKPKVNNI